MELPLQFSFFVLLINLLIFLQHVSQLTASSVSQTMAHLNQESSYFFYQRPEYPRDCQEIINQCSASNSLTSGVYLIKPDGYPQPFEVFCDNSIESEGWTVIQRRTHGSVDFNRNWTEYKEGFGFLSSEFWLGNEMISFLTNRGKYELRIDMTNAAGLSFSVRYNQFRISDNWGNFELGRFGECSGNAGNVTTFCPTNMEYGNCYCQSTCSGGCQKNCVDGEETCVCPNGLFLDETSNCVNDQECSCYAERFGVILESDSQVNSDCSKRCSCSNNQLSCVNIQCSSDAICQEILGVFQCQCKTGFFGDGFMCRRPTTVPPTTPSPIRDCFDLCNSGVRTDGVYEINPSGMSGSEFQVYCDMTTDGGGWTVFQRRRGGRENFYRNWAHYKSGFGSLSGEHWLGNDKIHTLTGVKNYHLRVELTASSGSSYYQVYDYFSIEDEFAKYRISLRSNRGTAGSSLFSYYPFSTYDRDNDRSGTYNCAQKHRSGWWFHYASSFSSIYCWSWPADGYNRRCSLSNLNGDYTGGNGGNIYWFDLPGTSYDCNIPRTEMKIRPM